MGMFGGITKNLSKVVGNVGALNKNHLGKVGAMVSKVAANPKLMDSIKGAMDVSGPIGKMLGQNFSGMSNDQKESMMLLMKSKMATAAQKVGNAANNTAKNVKESVQKAAESVKGDGSVMPDASKLKELINQRDELNQQIQALMKMVHKGKSDIISNLK